MNAIVALGLVTGGLATALFATLRDYHPISPHANGDVTLVSAGLNEASVRYLVGKPVLVEKEGKSEVWDYPSGRIVLTDGRVSSVSARRAPWY